MSRNPDPSNAAELFSNRGLSNPAVSILGGIHTSTVGRIVKGEQRAGHETVVALARALGIDPRRMRRLCDAHYLAAHPDEAPAVLDQAAVRG